MAQDPPEASSTGRNRGVGRPFGAWGGPGAPGTRQTGRLRASGGLGGTSGGHAVLGWSETGASVGREGRRGVPDPLRSPGKSLSTRALPAGGMAPSPPTQEPPWGALRPVSSLWTKTLYYTTLSVYYALLRTITHYYPLLPNHV